MIFVHPRDQERYCLRLLLSHVPGARQYKCLRTVEGTTYDTFKQAAIARGLMDNDVENRALHHIQELLELQGQCLADYPGIPVPPALAAHAEQQPMLIARELDYDAAQLQESVVAQTAMLNADQQYVY